MRITRCYTQLPLQVGTQLALPEAITAHLLRVLRLQTGDRCVLFNGDGHDYEAKLVEVSKRHAIAEISVQQRRDNESPLRIHFVQGIARGEKMDWILQKATELGVSHIQPVSSDHCEVKLDAQRSEKRLQHWQQVVISACEQSGRATVPLVADPLPLPQAVTRINAPRWVLHPEATSSLVQAAQGLANGGMNDCGIAIGPEGGWSTRDLDTLIAAGWEMVHFGPRILRTETAGLAAISALQAVRGDMA